MQQITQTLSDELAARDRFRLPHLGTFGTTFHPAHRWFDPLLRRFRRLPEHFSVFFRPARELKDRLKRRPN